MKLLSNTLKINKLANALNKNKNGKTMLLTYKYKLYKSKKTKHIDELIDIACSIYNHCIALHKRHYKLYHKSLNKVKLQKHLTKLKKLNIWEEPGHI